MSPLAFSIGWKLKEVDFNGSERMNLLVLMKVSGEVELASFFHVHYIDSKQKARSTQVGLSISNNLD